MAGAVLPKGLAWLPVGEDPVGRYVALRDDGTFLRDADGRARYFVAPEDALDYRARRMNGERHRSR